MRVTWTYDPVVTPLNEIHAAIDAFCTVRRPETIATVFDVAGATVDLTKALARDPSLRQAGEQLHYLVPAGLDGKVDGPFAIDKLPADTDRPILTLDLLTGEISISPRGTRPPRRIGHRDRRSGGTPPTTF